MPGTEHCTNTDSVRVSTTKRCPNSLSAPTSVKPVSFLLLPLMALGITEKVFPRSPFLPSFHPLQDKEVAFFVPWIRKLLSPRASQSPGLLAPGCVCVGGGAAGFCWLGAAGGHRRRWGGGHSQLKGGEGGRRLRRAPGLVTAGGLGNPRPHTLTEMAGGDGWRVVGTLHLLLLLAAVLSLTAGSGSPGTAAWTQEKVRAVAACCT